MKHPKHTATFRVCKLVRERTVTYRAETADVSCPEVAAQVVRSLTRGSPTEWMVALYLDGKNELVGCCNIARGGAGSCGVLAADVFRPALAHAARSMVLAHNHPSGDPTPSTDDWSFARTIRRVGNDIGIPLLDSLVVCDDSWRSMAQEQQWPR